jgi:predicted transcriptional regulator of viral defense system
MSTQASDKPEFDRLYRFAERQLGFFTAHQAIASGYSRPSHTYHVKNGDWRRCERGIYRLTHYPSTRWQDVMIAYLWASDIAGKPQGVISHDTAFEVHGLSTWVSPRYHLTVPKRFRKRGESHFRVQFHPCDLPVQDIEVTNGFRVTKPLRTIVDLLDWGQLEMRHLKDGLRQALDRNLILPEDIRQLKLTDDQKASFKTLLNLFSDEKIQDLI